MGEGLTEWIDFNQKNKPQSNALAGGIFLLIASGLQVGWIFSNELQNFPWAQNHSSLPIIFTYASFYIAATVGLYLSSMCVNRLTKMNIYVSRIRHKKLRLFFFLSKDSVLILVFGAYVCLHRISMFHCNAEKSLPESNRKSFNWFRTRLRLSHLNHSCIRNYDAKASRTCRFCI